MPQNNLGGSFSDSKYDIFLNGGTLPDGTVVAGWNEFAQAIHSAVPHAAFTGPAAGSFRLGEFRSYRGI